MDHNKRTKLVLAWLACWCVFIGVVGFAASSAKAQDGTYDLYVGASEGCVIVVHVGRNEYRSERGESLWVSVANRDAARVRTRYICE